MKIWRANEFGDPGDVLKLEEHDAPAVPDKGFAMQVSASGVGLPDLFMVQGVYPLVTKPFMTPGQEVVGIVTETGKDCPFSIGDRVITTTRFPEGWGGFAETFVATSSGGVTSLAPDVLTDEQAAGFLIPFHTGHGALVQRARLQAGETLLVLGGAGSSGSAAIQIGKAVGATVIAVAGSEEKMQFCLDQGADFAISYRDGKINKKVLELTEGKGANVIYDPVGGDTYGDARWSIAHDGRIVLIGFASGSWPKLSAADLVQRSYSVMGAFMFARTQEQVEQAKADLTKWTNAGLIKPPVDKVFSFDQVPQLMERLKAGEMLGKMVLKVKD